jgi:hypothetical protein
MFHALDPYEDGKMICRMVDGVMQVYEDEAAAGGWQWRVAIPP